MFDFLSSDAFMPHGHCYLWEPGVLWLQVVSNGLIGLSYVAIAVTLTYLVVKGELLPFKGMALAFGSFIIFCGFTHFFDIYVIWNPAYWMDGGLRALTAIVSVGTAILLPPLVPKALALARGARAAREHGIELEEAIEDLHLMYEKTRQLDELKTQFFANVSHELRTPLALVIGPAEKLRAAENLTDAQRRDLDVVLRNSQTLLKHVNDLLDVSRIEAGKLDITYERADLSRLVRLVASHFEALARDRNMRFAVDAPETMPAEVDAEKMQRVVLNLLSNAFKFTGSNGVVRVTLRQEGEQAVLEVADSGPGVRPEERQLIFERFRQSEAGSTRKHGGTGLGLTIVRDFVELHRGHVWVGTAPEAGALFRVELPLSAPDGAAVQEASTASHPAADNATRHALEELRARTRALSPSSDGDQPLVLVVEDNPDMNEFVCQTLAAGFRTARSYDGRDGLEKAIELKPDLILCDIMMPEKSGDELVADVRKREDMQNIPILLLTAKADDDMRVQLLRNGAQDYVTKPFAAPELCARVENLVAMKRARDVLQAELDTQMKDLETLARDITHRKRELQTAFESMRVAREHAERASQVKSSFLNLVSHELRSPLATLQLQLERLRLEDRAGVSPETHDLIGRMKRSANRLQDLIESLLHHTRLQSGRLVLEISRIDVTTLLEQVREELSLQAADKELTVTLEVEPSLPSLESDGQLVRLILINLVGNAIKFSERGTVRVAASFQSGRHRFAVTDTGPGIPREEQVRIFEPFEQGEPARKKHRSGVGLGLALVREMTDALGGIVQLDSTPGVGSTFTVTLPSSKPTASSTERKE